MLRRRTALILTILLLTASFAACAPPGSQANKPRHLRIVLYPFIPEFAYAAETVKTAFEAANPDVELTILDLSANYYSPSKPTGPPDRTYIGDVHADVYELDSVFLSDFVHKHKIQPLPDDLLLPPAKLLKNANIGSMLAGRRYGSPHWVCGNFLFFKTKNSPSKSPSTLKEVEQFVGKGPGNNLLVDLRGRLTLGELYLGAAYARYKDWATVKDHLTSADESVDDDLVRVFRMCSPGDCRDQLLHELTGVYGREFALSRSKALIGYSEILHDVLTEGTLDQTLTDRDLAVAALPLDDAGTMPISWVDSFVIDSNCVEGCYQDAARFIRFMQRDDVYLKLLLPGKVSFLHDPSPNPEHVPAYLLPAKLSLYTNPHLLKEAHLYPMLKSIIEGAAVPTADGLNMSLRNISADVEKELKRASQ